MKERVQVQVFHEEMFNNIYKCFSGFAGAGYKCARPGRAGKSVGMFNGVFEIVVHDMPHDQAVRNVDQLRTFYTAGWMKLMEQ